jgi:hypothetical protein
VEILCIETPIAAYIERRPGILRKWFLDYIDQFSSPETFVKENVNLKIKHMAGRICENILLLVRAKKTGEDGCRFAKAVAQFHDLGRIEHLKNTGRLRTLNLKTTLYLE